jgi:hypothetical protein
MRLSLRTGLRNGSAHFLNLLPNWTCSKKYGIMAWPMEPTRESLDRSDAFLRLMRIAHQRDVMEKMKGKPENHLPVWQDFRTQHAL